MVLPGRNYYTEFVKQAPSDSVILTLACGKFRFNDLDLGEIGTSPRLMDITSATMLMVRSRLLSHLRMHLNALHELRFPSFFPWYEQKAVCILLTLLHLGIKNIRLGPSLPAFLSPNILNFLVENYGIGLITTPEEDIKTLQSGCVQTSTLTSIYFVLVSFHNPSCYLLLFLDASSIIRSIEKHTHSMWT